MSWNLRWPIDQIEIALVAYSQNAKIQIQTPPKERTDTYSEDSERVVVFVPSEIVNLGRVLARDFEHDLALPVDTKNLVKNLSSFETKNCKARASLKCSKSAHTCPGYG